MADVDDDDFLYSQLYGGAPPAKPAPPAPPTTAALQQPLDQRVTDPRLAASQHSGAVAAGPLEATAVVATPAQHAQPPAASAPALGQPAPEDDFELDITLDEPEEYRPVMVAAPSGTQAGQQEEDDELDVLLDEPSPAPPALTLAGSGDAAGPPGLPSRPSAPGRPSTAPSRPCAPSARPSAPGRPLAPHPLGPPPFGREGVPPPRPPGGVPPARPPPGQPPGATFFHPVRPWSAHGQGGTAVRDAVLPSHADAGQPIRLPGQTRVTPEEYREFLGLGHGDIFDLDIDRVVDAHWRALGAEPTDFFNYGLTPATWKDYCRRVRQYRLEFTMQRKIQTYEGAPRGGGVDPDLPPELRAAVAAERGGGGSRAGRGAPMASFAGGRARPPSEPRDEGKWRRLDAAEAGTAVIALAGGSDSPVAELTVASSTATDTWPAAAPSPPTQPPRPPRPWAPRPPARLVPPPRPPPEPRPPMPHLAGPRGPPMPPNAGRMAGLMPGDMWNGMPMPPLPLPFPHMGPVGLGMMMGGPPIPPPMPPPLDRRGRNGSLDLPEDYEFEMGGASNLAMGMDMAELPDRSSGKALGYARLRGEKGLDSTGGQKRQRFEPHTRSR